MPNIAAKHPDYIRRLPEWRLIATCVEGQQAVKDTRTELLPMPNPTDTSTENKARYAAYLQRAVFKNVTGRTLLNSVGMSFALPPVYTGPEELAPLLQDIDGGGVTAEQQSKLALAHCVAFARCGLLVDYPATDAPVSVAEAEAQAVRPKVLLYDPRQIINWATTAVGADIQLSFVMLAETYVKSDDGYEQELAPQWRELRFIEGVYSVRLWREGAGGYVQEGATLYPRKGQGGGFGEIPFVFAGAATNSPPVEKPTLLDLAELNVAHYRNSADYEEMIYTCATGTLHLSGVTEAWSKNVLKGSVALGARAAILTPAGGTAEILQLQPTSQLDAALDRKDRDMRALGSRLVEQQHVERTAKEAGIEQTNASSILASCCKNVSAAYARCLAWAGDYYGIETTTAEFPDGPSYALSTEFAEAGIAPDVRAANRDDYAANLITWGEARDNLKAGGVAHIDNDDARDTIEAAEEDEFAAALGVAAQPPA